MGNREPIPEPDRAGLRRFALMLATLAGGVFGLLVPWLNEQPLPLWPWLVAIVLTVWGLAHPASLRRPYIGWMHLGMVMGKVMNPVIIGLIFVLLICPTALVLRILKRDPLKLGFDEHVDTYRVISVSPQSDNLEKPF